MNIIVCLPERGWEVIWWFNGLWHRPHPFPLVLPHPHAHLPSPLPPTLTLPTNLISGMPHAEPSADTGAQCDSRIPPQPPPLLTLHHPRDLVCLLLPSDPAPLKATWREAVKAGVEGCVLSFNLYYS